MHPEALTASGANIFPALARFRGFYLAGGTALALQIGHRISVDFDLFSGQEIPDTLLKQVRTVFTDSVVVPSVSNPEELTAIVDSVKITWLAYPFPLVTDLVALDGLPAASIQEIGAMKAYTIGRRVAYKDYVDLHAILSGGHATLAAIIDMARKKYQGEFNDRLFLEQLISFQDIQDEPLTFLGPVLSRSEMESYLENQVKNFKL